MPIFAEILIIRKYMKTLNTLLLAGIALVSFSCNDTGADKATTDAEQTVAEGQGTAYAVNLDSSNVSWKAYHKGGFAPRWGTLNIQSGELTVDGDQVTAGTFTIDVNSLWVDPASVTEPDRKVENLQAHLKSADFFHAEAHPTATFHITSIADLDAAAASSAVEGANKTVSGNLTLLDSTINITFPAKIAVVNNQALVAAKFTVDRTAWGLNFGTDEVDPADWMVAKDFEVGVDIAAAAAN